MYLESLNATFVIDTFLLLLIGIGPKIALVPFLDATRQMPQETKRRVLRKMLTTAATVAVLLLVTPPSSSSCGRAFTPGPGDTNRYHSGIEQAGRDPGMPSRPG